MMGDARVRVKVVDNPRFRIEDLTAKTISKRCARDSQGSRCPSVGCPSDVRGARSMAPCVARDRWYRAWPAIDGTVRGPREIQMQKQ